MKEKAEKIKKKVLVKKKTKAVKNNLEFEVTPEPEMIEEEIKYETIQDEKVSNEVFENVIKPVIEPDLDTPVFDSFIKEKSDEEKFDEFLKSFPSTDIDKLSEAKDKVDSQIDSLSEDEENEDEEIEYSTEETGKKKRGRPKGSKNNSGSNVPNQNINKDIEDIRDANAMFFNGSLLISLMDFLFPTVIKGFYVSFLKNQTAKKIKHSDLVLTKDQIESLGDIPDKVSRIIFAKVNPILLFFGFYFIMSAMNFKMALENQERLEEENEKKK